MIEEEQAQGGSTLVSKLAQLLLGSVLEQKLSPDVMQYQLTAVQKIKQAIVEQQERLDAYYNTPDITTSDKNFKYSIYKLDIQRLNYLLKSYLRTRLFKIQKFAFYIVKDTSALEKLSKEEQSFAKNYAQLRYKMFESEILKDLHKDFRNLDGLEVILGNAVSETKKDNPSKQSQVNIEQPSKESYRFFKILGNPDQLRYQIDINVQNLSPDNRDIVSDDDILFMPYSLGEKLLLRGLASLV